MTWFTGCAERLFYVPTREVTPAPTWLVPRAEAVWFESQDGTRLRGWFLPADGVVTAKAPTVVHVHGNAGSMIGHLGFVEWMPSAGINVFLFDYRGYGESEGRAGSRAPLIADAKAALAHVRGRADVDRSRIVLFGVSLGGAIATIVAAEDDRAGGDLSGLALESPFASWREVAASAVGGTSPGWFFRTLAAVLIPDELEGAPRPVDAMATVSVPVLVVHGSDDTVVPVSQGRRLADAGVDAVFHEFPGGDHNSLQVTHPEAQVALREFILRVTAPGDDRPSTDSN